MKKIFLGAGAALFLVVFVFNSSADAAKCVPDTGKGGGGLVKGKGSIEFCDEDKGKSGGDDKEGEGDLRVKIRVYDCNGNETGEIIEKSKVKLYNKKGKKVDEDKTNFKGEANFYDIEEGKYRVKCEVPGYVNSKEPHKDYYRTNLVKIKDDERAGKTCHIRKASCNASSNVASTQNVTSDPAANEEKLAQTGGSIFDLIGSIF